MAIDTFIWFDHTGAAAALEVVGETQDDRFKKGGSGPAGAFGAFEIKDWSFDVQNKTTIGSATGGAGGGKAEFAEFTITKAVDTASPAFFKNCVAGAHYKEVVLACRKAGADPTSAGKEYLTYTFSTVFTTKVAWKHGDDGPAEDITFVYGQLKIEYLPQDKTGKLANPKIAGWSVLTNKSV